MNTKTNLLFHTSILKQRGQVSMKIFSSFVHFLNLADLVINDPEACNKKPCRHYLSAQSYPMICSIWNTC